MHNQISRKRQDAPCLELGEGRWRIYPVDAAGVNADTLLYENWTEYVVYEKSADDFGNEHWTACAVPEWASLLIAKAAK